MRKNCFVKIAIFLLISSLSLLTLAYFSGSLYFPSLTKSSSVDAAEPKYKTVIIDAGHGGEDGGASSSTGLIEKDINLDIAEMLAEMLKREGIDVIMTRNEDKLLYDRNVNYQGRKKKLDHAARLNIMQKTEKAVFISIHMNSFKDSRYSGLQVWYSQNYSDSQILANMIQSNNKKTLQPENTRKTKAAGSSIYLLNEATCPAVLVECGFLSNVSEAAKFECREYRQKVSSVIFSSLRDFLEGRSE